MIQRLVTHVVIAVGTAERSFSLPGCEELRQQVRSDSLKPKQLSSSARWPSRAYVRLGHAVRPITSRQFLTEEGIGQGVWGKYLCTMFLGFFFF